LIAHSIAQQVIAPRQEKISQQQSGGFAEALCATGILPVAMKGFEKPVGGGFPSARVRIVHNVVVDKGCGVENLERRGQRHHMVQVVERFGASHRIDSVW
jgi:hypothetical protein